MAKVTSETINCKCIHLHFEEPGNIRARKRRQETNGSSRPSSPAACYHRSKQEGLPSVEDVQVRCQQSHLCWLPSCANRCQLLLMLRLAKHSFHQVSPIINCFPLYNIVCLCCWPPALSFPPDFFSLYPCRCTNKSERMLHSLVSILSFLLRPLSTKSGITQIHQHFHRPSSHTAALYTTSI